MAWRSLPNLYDTRWMRTCGKDLNRMSQRRCALTNCQFFAGFCGLSIFVRTFVVRNAVDQNSQNERVSLMAWPSGAIFHEIMVKASWSIYWATGLRSASSEASQSTIAGLSTSEFDSSFESAWVVAQSAQHRHSRQWTG